MSPLGIKVVASETPSAAGTSASTGTAFIIGETDSGPLTAQLIKSMAAYKALYAEERTATGAVMFDTVETFFGLGGAQCYVLRAFESGEGTLVKAKGTAESILAAGGGKVATIEARYAGIQANKWKYEVKVVGSEAQIVLLNANSEVIEETPLSKEIQTLFKEEKGTPTATFGQFILKAVAGYEAAKTEKLKVLAAAELKAGTAGVNPAPVEADFEKLPEKFLKTLGPGQLLIPGTATPVINEKVHKAMGEHGLNNNRVAICDIGDSATVATLITNKKTYAANIAGYMEFHSSSCTIPGLTLGTTRTVPGSAVVAALCAQASGGTTNNDNQAPAGRNFPISPFVTGFTNTFTLAQMGTLQENGINAFAERANIPCLYGFSSALPSTTDKIYWQFSAGRERMALIFKGEEILEKFMFQQIDGRGQLQAALAGALQVMGNREWQKNALFGQFAYEAFKVNVGEPINTPTTISEGKLGAEFKCRISPFAEEVELKIVVGPVSESV